MSALMLGRSVPQLQSNPTMLNKKEFNEAFEKKSSYSAEVKRNLMRLEKKSLQNRCA
jgi:hypothetical protein